MPVGDAPSVWWQLRQKRRRRSCARTPTSDSCGLSLHRFTVGKAGTRQTKPGPAVGPFKGLVVRLGEVVGLGLEILSDQMLRQDDADLPTFRQVGEQSQQTYQHPMAVDRRVPVERSVERIHIAVKDHGLPYLNRFVRQFSLNPVLILLWPALVIRWIAEMVRHQSFFKSSMTPNCSLSDPETSDDCSAFDRLDAFFSASTFLASEVQSPSFHGPPFIWNSNNGAMFFLSHAFHASCMRLTSAGSSFDKSFSSSTSAARS